MLAVRLLEDYVVIPRVLGHAVGLSPLLVLVSVTSITVLFGGFAVLFAMPLAAVLATLVDVIVRGGILPRRKSRPSSSGRRRSRRSAP